MKNKSPYLYKAVLIKLIKIAFFLCIGINSFSQVLKEDKLLKDTSKNLIYILPGAEYMSPMEGNLDIIKIVGNAKFMHDSVLLRCNVGFINRELRFLKAEGNVIINQGDTLFLYGDSLTYDSQTKIAIMRGNVRMVKSDLTLTAPSLVYDMETHIAFYQNTGKVVSTKNQNTLTSTRGYYYSNKNTLSFKDSVILTNPQYIMNSDTLDYNEKTEIAYFSGKTTIQGEGNFIFCKNGFYDTRNDVSEFNKDAFLISDGHRIEGDKLYYDRKKGIGKAVNNIALTDTANKIIVTGDFGTRNEKTNISFVTGNTLVSKWFEDKDTLYLSADTIKVVKINSTKKNSLYCYYKVKLYKKDLQGICDSMVYLQSDSLIKMFENPYLWSKNSQMNGDTIFIQLANNKLSEINFRKNSFIIDAVSFYDSITEKDSLTNQYDQIKGKNIKAIFFNDTIRTVFVSGNGQSIYFTGEGNKPKQGINKIKSSDIEIRFNEGEINNILFVNQPDGVLTPIQDTKKEDEKLNGFNWKIDKKPTSKKDLINEK